ncbi:MAG: hypothetical protein ACYDEX_08415 [Mobilitalea sp.]
MKPGRKAKVGTNITLGDNELKCYYEQVKDEGVSVVRSVFQGVFEEICYLKWNKQLMLS